MNIEIGKLGEGHTRLRLRVSGEELVMETLLRDDELPSEWVTLKVQPEDLIAVGYTLRAEGQRMLRATDADRVERFNRAVKALLANEKEHGNSGADVWKGIAAVLQLWKGTEGG